MSGKGGRGVGSGNRRRLGRHPPPDPVPDLNAFGGGGVRLRPPPVCPQFRGARASHGKIQRLRPGTDRTGGPDLGRRLVYVLLPEGAVEGSRGLGRLRPSPTPGQKSGEGRAPPRHFDPSVNKTTPAPLRGSLVTVRDQDRRAHTRSQRATFLSLATRLRPPPLHVPLRRRPPERLGFRT